MCSCDKLLSSILYIDDIIQSRETTCIRSTHLSCKFRVCSTLLIVKLTVTPEQPVKGINDA